MEETSTKKTSNIKYVLILIISLFLVIAVSFFNDLESRGITSENVFSKGIGEVTQEISINPEDESLIVKNKVNRNSFKDGDLLVFYRAWCPYCHTFIRAVNKDDPRIYWANTRTFLGKELKNVFNVKEVPTVFKWENGKFVEQGDLWNGEELNLVAMNKL